VSAAYITVEFTNTSRYEGWYGEGHRIERYVNGSWETIPIQFMVPAIAVMSPPGLTVTYNLSLHQEQHDYQPGRYRVTFVSVPGELSAEFTLT